MPDVADAIRNLHSQKMAHPDLKNILVDSVGSWVSLRMGPSLRRLPFGLAKTKRDITRYPHNMGARRWMAPEIFGTYKEDLKADAFSMKADVYSAGIVCFEILSREVLFSAVQPAVLYKKFAAPVLLRLRLPSSCPTNLVPLICACWDGNPRKRSAFADVCRVLRCLKGLLMTDSKLVPSDGEFAFWQIDVHGREAGPSGSLVWMRWMWHQEITSPGLS